MLKKETMKIPSSCAAVLFSLWVGAVTAVRPDPSQWMSSESGMEYQQAPGQLSPLAEYHWRRLTNADDTTYGKLYVDGAETYYDEYAQAWRALGFYIDCDTPQDDRRHRHLQDNNNRYGCTRYVLWAAYIDEGYEGSGVAEYMYFDRHRNRWDNTACKNNMSGISTRCVKMDCHLPTTHYSLLGFFKEPNYDEWMGQLFKNQGDCLWTDEEYQFMQSNRGAWPTGCTESIFSDDGEVIYYDFKPEAYGSMSIGLYTDASCVETYTGEATADKIIKTMVCGGYVDAGDDSDTICGTSSTDDGSNQGQDDTDSSIWSLEESLSTWNDAFDVFKQCQPCKASDLSSIVAGIGYEANANGDRYINAASSSYNNDDDDGGNSQFRCRGDSGNNDVNQCMKFKTKTNMVTATWRDVEMAEHQGTLTGVSISSNKFTATNRNFFGRGLPERRRDHMLVFASWLFLLLSITLLVVAIWRWYQTRQEIKNIDDQPLVRSSGGVTV